MGFSACLLVIVNALGAGAKLTTTYIRCGCIAGVYVVIL